MDSKALKTDQYVILQPTDRELTAGAVYGSSLGWRTLFDKALTPSSGLTAGIIEMARGAVGKLHWHAQAELYLVLSGVGTVEIEGVVHVLRPETCVFIPGNARHALVNTGDADLRIFYVFAADGMADITYHFADGGTAVLS